MMNLKSADVKKAAMEYTVYVPLGAGNLLMEKAKDFYGKTRTMVQAPQETMAKSYEDLSKRGHMLATSVRKSTYTRRAMDQTKTARTQVKAAATSVRKAATANVAAGKAAAKKVS